jgi:hypothetical protein
MRAEAMVHTIYPRERREFVPRGEPPYREGGRRVGLGVVSLLDVPLLVANTSMGGTITALGPRGVKDRYGEPERGGVNGSR